MTPEYLVKGSHVIKIREVVDEHVGERSSFDELAAELPGRNTLLPPLLISNLYDHLRVGEVMAHAAALCGVSVPVMAEEAARRNADDPNRMYKVFLRMAEPVRTMRFIPQLWANYMKWGKTTTLENRAGCYVGECHGIPSGLREWTHGAWLGFPPAAAELAGALRTTGTIVEEGREASLFWLRGRVDYKHP